MTDPLTGREPTLPVPDDRTGREPFIGGEASIAQALLQLGDADTASTEVLVTRLAGALPQLAALLHEGDERKRSQAARLIGIVAAGHPPSRGQSVPLLVDILDEAFNRDDQQTVDMAIDALGQTADPLAAEALTRVMASGRMYGYMTSVLSAFRGLGTAAVPPLLAYARHDWGIDWLCDVLAEICRTNPQVVPSIVEWITPLLLQGQLMPDQTDSSGLERTSMSNWRLLRQLHSTPLVDQMIEAIADQSRGEILRRHLIRMLACIPDERASTFLFELLIDDTHNLRIYVTRALCHLRRREDIPRVIDLIRHPAPRVRSSAIAIAGKRGIRSAVPRILEALSDHHASVRRRAVIALRQLRVGSTMPALIGMAEDRAKAVRLEMVTTLSLIRHHFPQYRNECDAAFQKLITDPDAKIRQEAERASRWYPY